jgi:hypothetical protein
MQVPIHHTQSEWVVGNIGLVTSCINSPWQLQNSKTAKTHQNAIDSFNLPVPELAQLSSLVSMVFGLSAVTLPESPAPPPQYAMSYFLAEKRLVQGRLSQHLLVVSSRRRGDRTWALSCPHVYLTGACQELGQLGTMRLEGPGSAHRNCLFYR